MNALVTNTPVRDTDGTVVAHISVARDITEAVRTTERLRRSQNRFGAVLRGSGDLFAITDAAGMIMFLDGPVESYFGPTVNSMIGTSLFDLVQKEIDGAIAENVEIIHVALPADLAARVRSVTDRASDEMS